MVKLSLRSPARIIVVEWPCAAGKSVVIAVKARFLTKQNPYEKVIICVPNQLLVSLMKVVCNDCMSPWPDRLKNPQQHGIFICTHDELIELSDEVLSKTNLQIDELHELIKKPDAYAKIKKANKVFALSATLNGVTGKARLKDDIGEECIIVNTEDQLK